MIDNPSPKTPEPEETGGSPEQRAASREESRALVQVLEGESETSPKLLSERIGSLGQAGIRSQAGFVLLEGAIANLENEKNQLRIERDIAIQKADSYRERYHEEKERAAVLRSERDAAKTQIKLRQILLTTGALIAGYGLRSIGEDHSPPWAWPSVIVGGLLLLGGWLLPDSSKQAGKS